MRSALAAAALALLVAACGVSVEGAPCSADASCPAGQGCGADRRCSTAALLCTHCRPGETACSAGAVVTCTAAANGICADFGDPVAPGPHQVCEEGPPGPAHLACAPSACAAAGAVCQAADAFALCEVDAVSGCAFAAGATTCPPGKICGEPQAGHAQCECAPDGPSLGQGCAGSALHAEACDPQGGDVVSCELNAALCQVWSVKSACASQGLVCAAPAARGSAGFACACPANPGATFYADRRAVVLAGVAPTGVLEPAACRFAELRDALAAANALAATTGSAAVRVLGGDATSPAVWSLSSLDQPPALAAGVSLAPLAGTAALGQYVLSLDGQASLRLDAGASLSGFVLQNAAGTGDAVTVSFPQGGPTAPAALDHVHVAGAPAGAASPRVAVGVRVTRGSITLDHVEIERTATAAVQVGASGAEADTALAATDCTIHDNVDGVVVNSGRSGVGQPVTIRRTAFADNGGAAVKALRSPPTAASAASLTVADSSFTRGKTGISVVPQSGAAVAAALTGNTISGMSDGGLQLRNVSAATALTISSNAIFRNCAASSVGLAGSTRRAGGVLLQGSAPPAPFAFTNNRIYGNGYDQVVVLVTSGSASLATSAPPGTSLCAAANEITCPDTARTAYGVFAIDTAVAAQFNSWSSSPPGAYDAGHSGAGDVEAADSYCAASTIACASTPLSCP